MNETHTDDALDARSAQQLFAAIIWRAILDACFVQVKMNGKVRPSPICKQAIEFLFNLRGDGACSLYLEYLDVEYGNFKTQLNAAMAGAENRGQFCRTINEAQRQRFKENYDWVIKNINKKRGKYGNGNDDRTDKRTVDRKQKSRQRRTTRVGAGSRAHASGGSRRGLGIGYGRNHLGSPVQLGLF